VADDAQADQGEAKADAPSVREPPMLPGLRFDRERWDLAVAMRANGEEVPESGILIRAIAPTGDGVRADISLLDKSSLLAWLRSGGGDNRLAEDVVGILLGHGRLHEPPGPPH
jgi:hypothetical protein